VLFFSKKNKSNNKYKEKSQGRRAKADRKEKNHMNLKITSAPKH
jgi:hypothetical protein